MSASNSRLFKVSVIIPNYNYAQYVGQAIDSALALDWPDVEVIVVDDGSNDASREVIARHAAGHANRIQVIHQANQGQVGACNTGFAASTGQVIIFLDSDDFLEPSVIREVAGVWRPGISKVQFQMRCVGADGRPIGSFLPQFHVTPEPGQIRQWVMHTSAYPTPPGSGNVYDRHYLEKIFPLDHAGGRASDSCCIAAAPYLGDVITIPKPLVSYRIHGKNDGAFSGLDVQRFAREVTRATQLFDYARRIAKNAGYEVNQEAIRYSLTLLPYRVASYKLAPQTHPWPQDHALRMLADLMRGTFMPQGMGRNGQIAIAAWTMLVLTLPQHMARKVILWRFASGSRPPLLIKTLKAVGVLR
ncbi:MAG: glycosyltransferase [Aquabacterium sp.]|uniref:glycosyltransferase n=1 Tax=Aquabacterium sp. TaxID=1872578 RepID=UPI002721A604|nr:glycosyltransferase [Aquabacterium sp.]MDO9002145.1 glycosyltransferase [Aquabacterium sp.]